MPGGPPPSEPAVTHKDNARNPRKVPVAGEKHS